MRISNRGFVLAAATLTLVGAGQAAAQDNYDRGKSGTQLFASDCAICHKSPQGLIKGGSVSGLESFLREHYTASRQSAGLIAAYLASVDRAGPAAPASRALAAKKPKPAADDKSDKKQ
jgi:mono/diheme cytochrome c family protein